MYKFFVIVNNETGYFYKKYHYKGYYIRKNQKFLDANFTPILGRARIFESFAKAEQSLPHWGEKSWLTENVVSIKEMIADYV